jgi:flagellar basal body-associated protein FliL
MIAGIVTWLAAKGVSAEQLKVLVIIALALASIGGVIIVSSMHNRAVIDRHEVSVQLDVQTKGRAADQRLNNRINAGAAAIAEEREEFDNATANLPREGLTRRQRVDVCIELRDAGTDTTVIPQCTDLRDRSEAGARNRDRAR